MKQGEYTLNDLTALAGVSTRTVRYYISEGLLPPPVSAGPRATYAQSHLDRLLLIGHLKEAYLPLREIRRRLDGMTDQEVEEALAESATRESGTPESHVREGDDAASYLLRVMEQRNRQSLPEADEEPPSPAHPLNEPFASRSSFAISVPAGVARYGERHDRDDRSPAIDEQAGRWRRIELGPDAELHIREDAFDRNRGRIEWLVNWAQRVFK